MILFLLALTARPVDARDLVREAFAHRGVVAAAKARVRDAVAERSALSAPNATRLETGISTRPDVSGGEDLTLFVPFDFFGKTVAARRVGDATVARAEAEARRTNLDVQDEALTAYAEANSAQKLLGAARTQLELALTIQKTVLQRIEARSLPEVQSIRADIEVGRARQLVADRQADYQATLLKLQSAVGSETLPGATGDVEPSLISAADLESSRPDLLSLKADVRVAQSEGGQALAALRPDFEVQARRAPWSLEEDQYSVRAQFVIPLYDHGAARSRRNAARFREMAATSEFDDRLLTAKKELEASRIQLEASGKAVTTHQKLTTDAETLVAKTQRGFELGASTLLDLLDARRALAESRELLIAAELRRDQAVAAVLKAQGQVLEEPN